MSRLTMPAALVLGVSLALAGCATTGPQATTSASPAAETTVAPAVGETISGTGYSYTVPEGWGVPDPIEGYDPDSFAADLDDTDGFSDNVNVIVSPAGVVTPDEVESAGFDELESVGATDVTVGERVTVAGSESAHLSASMSANGQEYVIEQYYTTDDQQTYVVTFSFSSSVPQADREALAASVLATWTWE
ncbi:MAG: hypothetical protein QM611_11895 [Microbacterium sp.]|uniref:hypothetical protein n=1 Tax=Microbacterium sp. TaxID=51671 RepID=UPI0039E444B2